MLENRVKPVFLAIGSNLGDKKLNIEKDLLVDLKKIEAIEIMREEQLDKKRKIATQKFEIKIFTTSNKIITSIEDGLLYYFNNLTYVNDCYNLYKITIQNEIKPTKDPNLSG